jgi:general secretion pathway protein G
LTTQPIQSATPPARATRRPRAAQFVLGLMMLLATVLAFLIVHLTNDPSLSPKQRQARGEIRRYNGLFKDFYRVMGRYPSQQEGFSTIVQSGVLQEQPRDPWGHPYAYVYLEQARQGHVLSYGEDGQPGGVGEAADVSAGGLESEQRP